MGKTKQIAWTLLFAPGMFLLGLVSSFLLPAAPAYTGAVFALLTGGGLFIGPIFAAGGAVGFCGGLAVFTLVLGDGLWPLALWLLVPMAALPPLLLRGLRQKAPLWHVMVNTAIGVFVYGAVSYIACNLLLGDAVAFVTNWLQQMLQSIEEAAPQLYDMLLSTWSSMGLLSEVDANPLTGLDETTRTQLTAELLEVFDLSLRLNLIDMLVKQALHIGFLSALLPLLAARRSGRAEEFSELPDLGMVRIPTKLNLALMLGILVMWVLLLVSSNAYAVYLAVWSVVQFLYAVQGLSVSEWFLKKHGWPRPVRLLVQAVGLVFLQTLLFLIGFLEQIFYFRKIGKPTPRDFGLRDADEDDDSDDGNAK
ncbi:MAG: DUF2232 domain-containing protein [Candidatus Spyradocola sp.]|jgi:hypothetical protein